MSSESEVEPIFRLELPLRLAPTMNVYSSLKRRKWLLGAINREVDKLIMVAKERWPAWRMGMTVQHVMVHTKRGARLKQIRHGGRRRLVRCYRYSSSPPDEVNSVDVIGGKLPVDRLVIAEVLRDDSHKWCKREASWVSAPRGQGRVVIEVWPCE